MSIRGIIVGYEAGASSRDALELATLLQRASGAKLTVANVYRHDPVAMRELPDRRIALRAGALDVLADARGQLPYGSDAELRPVRARSVVQGLHELAESDDADLIVVGSPFQRTGRILHGGSTIGERLLHASPCAVAIAPRGLAGDPDPALRVIGVTCDGAPESLHALAAARELALAAHGTIRLIGIAEPVSTHTAGLAAMSGWSEPDGIGRDRLQRELEARADALPAVLRPQVVVAGGDPAEEIVKRAGVLSLLVMGSRGYGPLKRALLGSVSGPVVRAAVCPVLVLPRGVSEGLVPAAAGAAS